MKFKKHHPNKIAYSRIIRTYQQRSGTEEGTKKKGELLAQEAIPILTQDNGEGQSQDLGGINEEINMKKEMDKLKNDENLISQYILELTLPPD